MTSLLFDANHVQRAFGRAAKTYAQHAVLQHRIEDLLLERLDYFLDKPTRVLDVGCGPGRGSNMLRERYRAAQVIALDLARPMLTQFRPHWRRPIGRVCADARELPFADASVDVLFSSLCIQWIGDVPALLAEFRRVLRPSGYLAFSTFGPDTLYELRAAWSVVDDAPHVSGFADIGRVGDALLSAGFRDPVLDVDHFKLTYADAGALMRELKAIGATNADARRTRGLTGKSHYRRAVEAYEPFRENGFLPATYEVIFAHAWAPGEGQPRRQDGEEIASFSVDRLRGSRRT
ncbi:MAG: malonyl-ACP O-methyltransferase BioC [Rudaea sp.]